MMEDLVAGALVAVAYVSWGFVMGVVVGVGAMRYANEDE